METKEILKLLREKNKYSMQYIAEKTGISYSVYQKYESGVRGVGVPALQKLADFYSVTTDYLLGRPETQQPERPIDLLIKEQSLQGVEEALLRMYFQLDRKKRAEFLQSMFEDVQKNLSNQQNENDSATEEVPETNDIQENNED